MRKRVWRASLIICFIIIISGVVWQNSMENKEMNQYMKFASYINVGSYNMNYHTVGDGEVAYVLISGSGTPCAYTDFYYMQQRLSNYGQVVVYDHAGVGLSTKTDVDRSIDNIVDELSLMINEVAMDKPVVIICHSLGSLEALSFTQKFKEKVQGIIFLDSGSPEFYSTNSEVTSILMNRVSSIFRETGLIRLLGESGVLLPIYGEDIRNEQLPEELKKLDKILYYNSTGNYSNMDNIQNINENAAFVLKGNKLDDIPILVLSSDSGSEWQQVQLQLAQWSDNSNQITIQESQHYIHWSNYDEVMSHIINFIEMELQ
ncbi:MAG: alpha/beta hydrolase [Lachnospiraceae bacterium]